MNKSVIYARAFGKLYKLFDIVLRNDESIYLYFPRRKGYIIKNKQDIDLGGQQSKTFTFNKNVHDRVTNPYVSFHPGKGVIHVNAFNEEKKIVPFLKDRMSHSFNEILDSQTFFPILTVLIPPDIFSFDSFDVPHKNNLIANIPPNFPKALSVDLIIHEKGGYVDKTELPYARLRDLAFMAHLKDIHTNKISYTLVFNNVEVSGEELSREVITIIWNKEMPFSFCLKPLKD